MEIKVSQQQENERKDLLKELARTLGDNGARQAVLLQTRWGAIGGVSASAFLIVSFNIAMPVLARGFVALVAFLILGAVAGVLFLEGKENLYIRKLALRFLEEAHVGESRQPETKEIRELSECEKNLKKWLRRFTVIAIGSLMGFLVVTIFIWDTMPFGS